MSGVGEAARVRGVGRICHLSSSRHLCSILTHRGLLSVEALQAAGASFAPNDTNRLDGHPELICCSVEHPNWWYGNKARTKQVNYPDWMILLLDPAVLNQPGALFCDRNAAAGGANLRSGVDGFAAMYADSVTGAGGSRQRGDSHLPSAPTDDQAEVLLPGPIGLDAIMGVVVESEPQARRETERLTMLDHNPDQLSWLIGPGLFRTGPIRTAATGGAAVSLTPWSRSVGEAS